MATISHLKKILKVLEDAGKGEEFVFAAHDVIFLLAPGEIVKDSENGKKLSELGCLYDGEGGWTLSV